MKKNIVIIFLIIINIITGSFLLYKVNKTTSPTIYSVDIYEDDISLENFTIVAFDKSYYIPNTYKLSKVGKEKKFEKCSIQATCEGELIQDVLFEFDKRDDFSPMSDRVGSRIRITPQSVVTFKIKYTMNNKENEVYKEVKLNKFLKQN